MVQRIFLSRSALLSCSQRGALAAVLFSVTAAACTDDDKPHVIQADAGTDGAVHDDGGDAKVADARVDMDAKTSTPEAGTGIDADILGYDGAFGYDANGIHLDAATDSSAAADTGSADASVVGGVGAPALTIARARQIGRFGGDLRIDLSAVRGERTVVAVKVELLTSQLTLLGTARVVPLESLITALTGDSYVLLAGIFERFSNVSSVRLSLVDELGAASPTVDVAVALQTVVALAGACDDKFLDNRCGAGLGCKPASVGAAKACNPGVAPQLTRLGYFVDEIGPRIVFEGTDVDADATGYRIQFFDEQDAPIAIDHDIVADTPPVSQTTGLISTQDSTTFFVQLVPSDVMVDQVFRVRVNATDSVDNASNVLVADRSEAPEHALGSTCDVRAFNRCSDGGSCVDTGDQDRCLQATEAQTSACTAALVLSPSSGTSRVRGSVQSSLWDAPPSCSPYLDQEDRVVKLVLTEPALRVTLSADHPYTGFDAVLYWLASCTATPQVERCNAPTPGSTTRSVLSLQNVAAGTYYVVVDSHRSPDDTSDTFELTATLE
jgi:hypothetical protein